MTHLSLPAIQSATRDDEDAVAHLFEALHKQNAALDERFALAPGWRAVLHRDFTRTWNVTGACWRLAWSNTEPVGLIVLEAHTDSPLFRYRYWAELVALYVTSPYRGSGLADRLIAEGLAWATDHGFEHVQLYVTASNKAAHACYQRCGFVPVQQILRRDLHPAPGIQPPADPSCALMNAASGDALETGQHHLAMELERNRKEHP
ncbi:MAG: Ribosomal protein S18 acetylase RimI [Chloroflexi bacterium AL-W]|nr:Ribosomal protein S18 acetylase RimI [Chloroflexi bacterium AL-N1]NOK66479.1 Ribosomal protein S18 acetylase RimI [Chloroflexi bacterium AL-N10]NOK71867.1 Ribosomal protein S18 acetylase RimI [Chloroflexi bacterium AL-N5]NOK81124.1 Ribosomal protein S18 acetylase RimI [Chloroflexi bacterium AL-W]NOK89397.1 Ribosomal protein S18 acetylase RimI [Chloroflexi bacterium AL-N15]